MIILININLIYHIQHHLFIYIFYYIPIFNPEYNFAEISDVLKFQSATSDSVEDAIYAPFSENDIEVIYPPSYPFKVVSN